MSIRIYLASVMTRQQLFFGKRLWREFVTWHLYPIFRSHKPEISQVCLVLNMTHQNKFTKLLAISAISLFTMN